MKTPRALKAVIEIGVALLAFTMSPLAFAHGGVVLEEDLCIINIGFYQAHFTIFQPRARAHEQFCEDLPHVGESVFVVEYLHNGLEQLPVDFRIVKNTTNLGRFATWEDVQAMENLQENTVFYQPPVREPDVLTVLHDFDEPGEFIGVVTSIHPDTEVLYTAVFPFAVGSYGVNYRAIIAAAVFLIPLIYWLAVSRRPRRLKSAPAALVVAALIPSFDLGATEQIEYPSAAGYFRVSIESSLTPITINQMHNWQVRILDAQGEPVADAVIAVAGGMPGHDHGLPTLPAMTQTLTDGHYLIQGMKFHMGGAWEIQLTITASGLTDIATIDLKI